MPDLAVVDHCCSAAHPAPIAASKAPTAEAVSRGASCSGKWMMSTDQLRPLFSRGSERLALPMPA
jgi:hypothetical protein